MVFLLCAVRRATRSPEGGTYQPLRHNPVGCPLLAEHTQAGVPRGHVRQGSPHGGLPRATTRNTHTHTSIDAFGNMCVHVCTCMRVCMCVIGTV